MSALSLIWGLVQLALAVLRWMSDKRLIEAGAAQAIAAQLEGTQDAVAKARAARAAVDHSADAVRNDPQNRDRS